MRERKIHQDEEHSGKLHVALENEVAFELLIKIRTLNNNKY